MRREVFCLCLLAGLTSGLLFENSFVSFGFDDQNGGITHQIDQLTQVNLYSPSSKEPSSSLSPLWEISFVDLFGEIMISNVEQNVSFHRINEETLELLWGNITIQRQTKITIVDVILHFELPEQSSIASFSLSVSMVSGESLGIWQARISIPYTIASHEDGELFFPSGFGTTYLDPILNAGAGVSSLYPGSYAAMQYLSLGSSSSPSAGYFAAHDPNGSPKLLEYSAKISSKKQPVHLSSLRETHSESQTPLAHFLDPKSSLTSEDLEAIQTHRTHSSNNYGSNKEKGEPMVSLLRITIYPEDAGVALPMPSTWKSSYPLALGIVTGISAPNNRPLWYEAAQIYRQWSLSSAQWTQSGPLSTRTNSPPLPSWYRHNHLWINSHWQCHDVFNETGGDPNYILQNTKLIANLFNQKSLAMHWYEWQQGPDPAPEARYKFDTHYPDYFPPRSNFDETVSSLLQEEGIYTFPYINGRIFDIESDSYLSGEGEGEDYCAKHTDEKMIRDKNSVPHLESYIETYGSDASFCVANPSTKYWQDKVTTVVDELVNKYQVSGVYIDQIGELLPVLLSS
jgi:hypothetical protein